MARVHSRFQSLLDTSMSRANAVAAQPQEAQAQQQDSVPVPGPAQTPSPKTAVNASIISDAKATAIVSGETLMLCLLEAPGFSLRIATK